MAWMNVGGKGTEAEEGLGDGGLVRDLDLWHEGMAYHIMVVSYSSLHVLTGIQSPFAALWLMPYSYQTG